MFSNLLYLFALFGLATLIPDEPFDLEKTGLAILVLGLTVYLLKKWPLKWTLLTVTLLIGFFTFFGFLTIPILLILVFLMAFALRVYLIPKDKNSFLFLLPFSIPYLLISPFINLLSADQFLLLSIAILLSLFAFFPYLVQKIWRSTPLKETELKEDLEALCEKAHFKHGGLLEWKILPNMLTAGIMGVIPRFRYIFFTPSLLRNLQPQAIRAILAHEMGHHHYKHLLLFPFLFLSLLLTANVLIHFSGLEDPLFQTLLFFLIAALYYRFVGGYFSRLFERQADLYALNLNVPLDDMILALDEVGKLSGNSHKNPSWHHFSIQERIDFLNHVKWSEDEAKRHHLHTYVSEAFLLVYVAVLIWLSW